MFDPDSRYALIEVARHETLSGRSIAYVRRRMLPRVGDEGSGQVTVVANERVDHLAARVFGDPLQFWNLCDANEAMIPDELVEQPGRRLRVRPPGTPRV